MKSQTRQFYIDGDTFGSLVKLAGSKRITLSAMLSLLINDAYYAQHHSNSTIHYRCSECTADASFLDYYDNFDGDLYEEYVQMMRFSGPLPADEVNPFGDI